MVFIHSLNSSRFSKSFISIKQIILYLCILYLIFCSGDNLPEISISQLIFSEKPKYKEVDFIEFKKLFDIPLMTDDYILNDAGPFQMDKDSNLYVMDIYSNQIIKFDPKGRFIRKFGGTGDGPSEFRSGRFFVIENEKFYILEKNKGIKVWDINGKYLDYILGGGFLNMSDIKIHGNKMYMLNSEGNLPEISSILSSYSFNNRLKREKVISEIKIDINKERKFSLTTIPIDSDGNIYSPVLRDEHLINKYDHEGNLVLTFGRKYKQVEYSDEIVEWSREVYKNEADIIIKKYPPVIRFILIDDRDLVWVIVGESYGDNYRRFSVTSTIDIFNTDGEFLYSFESNLISSRSLIRNNRLYSQPLRLDDYGEMTIGVYEVEYNLGTGH